MYISTAGGAGGKNGAVLRISKKVIDCLLWLCFREGPGGAIRSVWGGAG